MTPARMKPKTRKEKRSGGSPESPRCAGVFQTVASGSIRAQMLVAVNQAFWIFPALRHRVHTRILRRTPFMMACTR